MYTKTLRFPELTFYGADQAERDAHFYALSGLLKQPDEPDARELAEQCRGFIARRTGCGNKIDTPIHLFIRHGDWAHVETVAQLFTDYVEAEYIDVDRLISSASTKYEWNSIPMEAAICCGNADALAALVLHGADTSVVPSRGLGGAIVTIHDLIAIKAANDTESGRISAAYVQAQMQLRLREVAAQECKKRSGTAAVAPPAPVSPSRARRAGL